MSRKSLATVWLDGCSGCHMSFLDIDERILDLIEKADLVYSPLVDTKEFPDKVDITLVEGAIGSDEDRSRIRRIRRHSTILVSLGDCAVNSNVPGMRNYFSVEDILKRGYLENSSMNQRIPEGNLPSLLSRACPVHEVVKVDVFVPGCPPSSDAIFFVLSELLEGHCPNVSELTRFGA